MTRAVQHYLDRERPIAGAYLDFIRAAPAEREQMIRSTFGALPPEVSGDKTPWVECGMFPVKVKTKRYQRRKAGHGRPFTSRLAWARARRGA